MSIYPDNPEKCMTFVSLVKPSKMNGSVGYEIMMVADEAWVRKNLGDIELKNFELPDIFTPQLCGDEE